MWRRAFVVMSAIACLLFTPACSRDPDRARDWPTRSVRLVVPYAAGTSSDLAARIFAPVLAERWGQAVVVDNRPGADGVAGTQAFLTERDSHALLFSPLGIVTTTPIVHADLPFDPARDLVPVASAASTSIAIAVSNDSGISSIQELATLARARPGGVLWTASAGLPEFLFRAWCAHERLNLRHVAYRDPSAALLDLGQGRVEVMVAALPTLAGAVDAQRARLIAVATPTRSPGAADVPTLAELGYDHLSVETPQGIFAARGTPGDLITRIAEAVGAAAEDIELTARLKRIGFRPAPSGPAEFARSVELQTARVRAIADAAKHLEGGSDVRVP